MNSCRCTGFLEEKKWIATSKGHDRGQFVGSMFASGFKREAVSGIFFQLCASKRTRMPARNRLTVSLPLEQFLSAVLLGIFSIQNLEPCALFRFAVGCSRRRRVLWETQ